MNKITFFGIGFFVFFLGNSVFAQDMVISYLEEYEANPDLLFHASYDYDAKKVFTYWEPSQEEISSYELRFHPLIPHLANEECGYSLSKLTTSYDNDETGYTVLMERGSGQYTFYVCAQLVSTGESCSKRSFVDMSDTLDVQTQETIRSVAESFKRAVNNTGGTKEDQKKLIIAAIQKIQVSQGGELSHRQTSDMLLRELYQML